MSNTIKLTALLVCGLALGVGNCIFPYFAMRNHLLAWNLVFGTVAAFAIAAWSRSPMLRAFPIRLVLPAALIATFFAQAASQAWWPNSADEYGYLFLADTLWHGRLWNAAPPVPQIFDVIWICLKNGEWFSQYPPAWPALLAPFHAAHLAFLVNPLLGFLLGALSWHALRGLAVEAATAACLVALLVFSPFVAFNAASLFPHVMTAVLVIGIVILQDRDEKYAASPTTSWMPRNWGDKAGIGALFGILLLTRYDCFLLTAACYGIDRLWRRRLALLADAIPMAAGAIPGIAIFLAYNAAITGHPLTTPYAWASPGASVGLPIAELGLSRALLDAIMQSARWAGELVWFTSLILIAAYAIALTSKLRARTLRWYDLLLPACLAFFFFYPHDGGHGFGPRYWFLGWPTAILTIGTGLRIESDWIKLGKLRLHTPTLALAHLPVFAGVAITLAIFQNSYVTQRRQPYRDTPPLRPAIVLIPSRAIMITPIQSAPINIWAEDFARNGVDFGGQTLYSMADLHHENTTEYANIACTIPARHVFRWVAPARFVPVGCKEGQGALPPGPPLRTGP
jgi:hypothetical protein